MAPDSTSAWLEFPSGERFLLADNAAITIGRAPGNRLIISTDRVSRNHAAIRGEQEGAFTLVDLGSSNGTFLDGQRITRSVILRDGCVIEIGLQKMTFRTPPIVSSMSGTGEATTTACWLLAGSVVQLGCRMPGEDMIDKTIEGWTERAHRIVAKYRGSAMRGQDEGLLAYWPVESSDSRAATMGAVLRSLRIAPQETEEIRLSLHYGTVTLKAGLTGDPSPSGPDVIHTVQLDRLASTMKVNFLLTEAACEHLDGILATRRLTAEELGRYRGTERFHTVVD